MCTDTVQERDHQVNIVSDEQRERGEGGYRVSYQPVEDVSTPTEQHQATVAAGNGDQHESGSSAVVTDRDTEL